MSAPQTAVEPAIGQPGHRGHPQHRGVWAWLTAAEDRYWRGQGSAAGTQLVHASEDATPSGLLPLPVIVAARVVLLAAAAASAVAVVMVAVSLIGGAL